MTLIARYVLEYSKKSQLKLPVNELLAENRS